MTYAQVSKNKSPSKDILCELLINKLSNDILFTQPNDKFLLLDSV